MINSNSVVKRFFNAIHFKLFHKNNKLYICSWCHCYYQNNKYGYFCSKKCKKLATKYKNQIFKRNNYCKKHPLEKRSYRNQCWSCYKEKFKFAEFPIIKNKLKLFLHDFKVYPTFRTSTEKWAGDKPAFEQFLVDNCVKWFVYIKFYYIKPNKIKPLVIGKSGSLLVNASGSDLNFSTKMEDGPARIFLNYNNYNWCYQIVAIRKCKNEKEAYKIEQKFADKFNLYQS